MVKYAAHIEAYDTMACATVYGWYWMAVRWSDRRHTVTRVATEVRDHGGGVVRIGAEETDCRMAVSTFGDGIRRRGGGRLADRHGTVVATRARPVNSRMIEAAVRVQGQEAGGIVTVIALGVGRCMKFRFTDGQNAVMALTAIAKHFLMIDIRNYVKAQRRMAGFTRAAGGDVIR